MKRALLAALALSAFGCASASEPATPAPEGNVRSVKSRLALDALPAEEVEVSRTDFPSPDGTCQTSIVETQNANLYTTWFQHSDLGGCADAVGYAALGQNPDSYGYAAAYRWDAQGVYLVAASINAGNLTMAQYDFTSGDTVKAAVMAVDGSDGDGSGLTLGQMRYDGDTVVIVGTGTFPGGDPGDTFTATWQDFTAAGTSDHAATATP
jgi:hypothetical protein